jgi:hypothetical protein
VARLGTATSNLTFFQQVGGTVGLAVTGTIFASTMVEQVPRQVAAAEVPPQLAEMVAGGAASGQLTGVGDLGAAILSGVPEAARSQVEPFIPAVVGAINEAFTLATASTFTVGIVAALTAAAIVLLLREAPRRATDPSPATVAAGEPTLAGMAFNEPRMAEAPVLIEDD